MEDQVRAFLDQVYSDRGLEDNWRIVLAKADLEFAKLNHAASMASIERCKRGEGLSPKMREVFIFNDDVMRYAGNLSPRRFKYYQRGARIHLRMAIRLGASESELIEVVERASTIIGTQCLAEFLPMIAEEIALHEKGTSA